MAVVLITGMSGTGKSTALFELARRGHRVVDTDDDGWSHDVPAAGPRGLERLWREDAISALLDHHRGGSLFMSGCVANQGRFYPRFDAVAVLTAPLEVLLARIAARTNGFGRTDAQREQVAQDLRDVEPLLSAGATSSIDARLPVNEVCDRLELLVAGV